MERMGDLIYAYGVKQFGVVEGKKSYSVNPHKIEKADRNRPPSQGEESAEEAMEEGLRGREGGHKPAAGRDSEQACNTEES